MSLADWWSRRIAARCPGCGEPVPALATSCVHCGALNRPRRVWLAVAAVLPALLIAIGIAAFMIPRCCVVSGSPPDFAWLTKAMQDCDAEAAKQQSTLYFLVVPLAAKPEDEESWRSKSPDKVGNATLVNSDDALRGLNGQALRIAAENYAVNVRDGANVLYNWSSSSGVTRLTIPNADAIDTFNIQFQMDNRKSDTAWGNVFGRKRGNCYWVTAIIAN